MKPAQVIWIVLVVVVAATAGSVWLKAQGPQPAFGQLSVSPPDIILNTPTTAIFTIRIDTPTVNPTTVELQRIDAEGSLLTTVGRMYDNGQSGDAKPGDRVFTAVVSFNESVAGESSFRVVAAFRGTLQRALSPIVKVDVWKSVTANLGIVLNLPSHWITESNDLVSISISSSRLQQAAQLHDAEIPQADFLVRRVSRSIDETLEEFGSRIDEGDLSTYFDNTRQVISGRQAIVYSDINAVAPHNPPLVALIELPNSSDVLLITMQQIGPGNVSTMFMNILNNLVIN